MDRIEDDTLQADIETHMNHAIWDSDHVYWLILKQTNLATVQSSINGETRQSNNHLKGVWISEIES